MNEMSAQEGIRTLFDLYANDIYRYARFTLHDHDEAKDVVQEVFFRAFKQWEAFRHESSYKTWLLSIARNYMYDLLRKRRTHRKFLDAYTPPPPSDPHGTTEEMMALEQGLRLLKDSYRQVIILRHVQELSTSEVADILGWSEAKVRTTLSRALHELRKHAIDLGWERGGEHE